MGKFHSGIAYREGAHWHRKTQIGKGGQAECFSIQDYKTQMIMALKEVATKLNFLATILLKIGYKDDFVSSFFHYLGGNIQYSSCAHIYSVIHVAENNSRSQ